MTLAALEATLAEWVGGRHRREVPAARMISTEADELQRRADSLAGLIRTLSAGGLEATVIAGVSRVGGGAAPEVDLAGFLVAVRSGVKSAATLERGLRASRPPIVARVAEGRLLLDPRTLLAGEDEILARALARIAGES
jgi:L-seryl-tRNA(Ser) seleniumtransferase